MTDLIQLVRQLDVAAVRARLEELDRERAALRVLLRAACRTRKIDAIQVPARPPARPRKAVKA